MQPGDIILSAPFEGRRRARFRRLSAADELALFGCDYPEAIQWIAERLTDDGNSIPGSGVLRLPIADGDRLFAALYRAFFGERLDLRQSCRACPESFELSLTLSEIVATPAETPAEVVLAGGTRLASPTVGDLLAVADGEDFLARITLTQGSDDGDTIADAAAALAPATVEMIETSCPHCRAEQVIELDLPRFFLRCAEREREILLREVHLLARTYGWGLADTLSLARTERHILVRLATTTLEPRQRSRLA